MDNRYDYCSDNHGMVVDQIFGAGSSVDDAVMNRWYKSSYSNKTNEMRRRKTMDKNYSDYYDYYYSSSWDAYLPGNRFDA